MNLPIGKYFEYVIDWLNNNFDGFFDIIHSVLSNIISFFEKILLFPPPYITIAIIVLIAFKIAGKGVGLFTIVGLLTIWAMGLWEKTMITLALVGVSTTLSLIIGIPLGIWGSRFYMAESIIRPILDLMQTMPAFVYLIPAVLFFQLGKVPGIVATVIFAMPPAVRLTILGIKQVSKEAVEAAVSFGCTSSQLLFKVQLPLAMPTILAGINQTIMLALSMVVIAAMIGAGGLGGEILKGITQLKIDVGFEGGLAIVILAILLDRITQALGMKQKIKSRKN